MSRREFIEVAILVVLTLVGLAAMIGVAHMLASALAWLLVAVQG